MGDMASINIAAMGKLVSALSNAAADFPYDQWGFTSTLGNVNVDASPAQKLTAVIAWANSEVPGVRRRLALAQSIEAQSPGQLATVRIDESLISNVRPAQAQAQGAAAAKKLKDAGGKIDPKLLAEIAKNQNDPYFAAGFAKSLTPDQLADIVQQTSNEGINHRGNDRSAWFTQYQKLMSAVGTTVATSTRNTGDLALPSDTAQQWVDVFKREPGDDSFRYNEAEALSTLLKYGSYATPFLNKISTDVYNYERSKDGDPVWGPKSDGLNRIIDPLGTGGTSTDVMANVLDALGHNPDAAQSFFDVGNPNAATTEITVDGHKLQVNKRLEYLIAERTWDPTEKGSDDGRGLGLALQAATTFFRNNGETGKISATIASQTFAIIANKTGSGASGGDWYELKLNQRDGWKMWKGMRSSVANIVASYSPDLMRVAGLNSSTSDPLDGWTHTSDSQFPPNGPWGAQLNKDLMAKILGTLGEDQKNIDIVTAGVAAASQLRMSYALRQALKTDPNAPLHMIKGDQNVDLLSGASNEMAGTMAFVINNAYKGDASKQEFQKKQAEALSKAMGIALNMPFLAVPEAKPWTGFLIDQAKDVALDKIGEGPDQNAKSTYNDTASNTQTNLQYAMLNYLLANGYLGKQYYAEAGPSFTPPPDGAFQTGKDGTIIQPSRFDFNSPAYQNWARNGQNLQSWLNTNVIVPFRDKFPALGAG